MLNFIFKKFQNFPYSVKVFIPSILWCVLCAVFGIFIILSQADFEKTGTKDSFILSMILYVALAVFLVLIELGLLRNLGINIGRRDFEIMNKGIRNNHIFPDLSTDELRKLFNLLIRGWELPISLAVKYIILVIFLVVLTEFILSKATTNIPAIFWGGAICLVIAIPFVGFFGEYSFFPILKECRLIFIKKGIEREEDKAFLPGLRKKIVISLLFPIFIVSIILGFFTILNFYILILLAIGTTMAFIISQMISYSIYQTFSDIEKFVKKLPEKERNIFASGSRDKDILELSQSLNLAAEEVYAAKKELEDANKILEEKVAERTKELERLAKSLESQVEKKTKELHRKVEELEEFQKLTVGRELRMVELKKELQELKEQLGKAGEL